MEIVVRVLLGAALGGMATWLLAGAALEAPHRGWLAFGATAGTLTGILSFRSGHYDAGPAVVSSLIASALLAIAVCDLRERRISNRVTYPVLAGALCSAWVWPDRSVGAAFIGCAVAIGIVAALVFLGWGLTRWHDRGPAFGVGDMKLVVVLGAIVGWPLIAWSLLLGTTLGGIGAAVALVVRQRTIAYGPYLVAGGLVALLWPGSSPWT